MYPHRAVSGSKLQSGNDRRQPKRWPHHAVASTGLAIPSRSRLKPSWLPLVSSRSCRPCLRHMADGATASDAPDAVVPACPPPQSHSACQAAPSHLHCCHYPPPKHARPPELELDIQGTGGPPTQPKPNALLRAASELGPFPLVPGLRRARRTKATPALEIAAWPP